MSVPVFFLLRSPATSVPVFFLFRICPLLSQCRPTCRAASREWRAVGISHDALDAVQPRNLPRRGDHLLFAVPDSPSLAAHQGEPLIKLPRAPRPPLAGC